MRPILDYVYGKEIITETGVVSEANITDTRQKYEVIAVGPGRYEYGVFIKPQIVPGNIVIVQKHSVEGDTPSDMLNRGYGLFMASRIMAVEEKNV
jgi:co-chaperonin GroES (HSP10)